MKLYHRWLLGEFGIIVLVALSTIPSWLAVKYFFDTPTWLAVPFVLCYGFWLCGLLLKWYHRDTSMEDKFYHGGDDI